MRGSRDNSLEYDVALLVHELNITSSKRKLNNNAV